MDQRTLVEKADIAVANLIADGGYLQPEQSDTFIRKLLDEPTIMKQIRHVRMNSPIREIDKIGFDSRILRAATSAVPLPENQRAKPDLEKLTMTTKEIIAEVNIPYDVLEDNIERAGLEDTIMAMIVERAALDLEELLILGDTSSADSYLALLDGILVSMTSHVVNFADAAISKTLFKNGVLAMPDKFLRNRSALIHVLNPDQLTAYRDTLANRQTILGDKNVEVWSPVFAQGVPVQEAALMTSTEGFFTHPKNLVFGIQRQIQIETDKDIRARVIIIVLTLRCAFMIETEDACVKYTNIAEAS